MEVHSAIKPRQTTTQADLTEMSLAEYVLYRLEKLGITDVFGVPGDFSFGFADVVAKSSSVRWIGCCNELNAAYAADGYARVKGFACLSTTYGVGELSALCGVAGSYAESVPVFHVVGMPSTQLQKHHSIVHHTLGNGEFGLFKEMTGPAVCATSVLTPENCVSEMDRIISAAMYHRRPVYLAMATDHATATINFSSASAPSLHTSDPTALREAVKFVSESVDNSERVVVLPGSFLSRYGCQKQAQAWIESTGLPFATMAMDKGIIDETHPQYIGMYDGKLMSDEVREFVEGSDLIILLDTLVTDWNTGAWTAKLDKKKTLYIHHHEVCMGERKFKHVETAELLNALISSSTKKKKAWPQSVAKPCHLLPHQPVSEEKLTTAQFFLSMQSYFRENDIIVVETGSPLMGSLPLLLPKGVSFLSLTLWGAIGWATPAALGAATAAPERRVILITGEGSFQVSPQDICRFAMLGLKPSIFLINNEGYQIERLLCNNPMAKYNDVPMWDYQRLPSALGMTETCVKKIQTTTELKEAIEEEGDKKVLRFYEVILGKMDAPEAMQKFSQVVHSR